MYFEFKLYEEGESNQRKDPRVTINYEKRIYMNARAVEVLGEPEAVALMFDESRQTIGIAPTSPEKRSAFRLRRKVKECNGAVINARGFFALYGIDPKETLEFLETPLNHDGIMILDLNRVKVIRRLTKGSKVRV